MNGQNNISTQIPAVFKSGTKTFTFTITGVNGTTGAGKIDPRRETLIDKNTGASGEVNTLSILPAMSSGSIVQYFREFWQDNPFFISRLNLRASEVSVLPTAVSVNTPNIFNGSIEKQIVEVGPNKTATQFQDGIVTLDTRLVVGRRSWIEIEGNMQQGQVLSLDTTISVFASLEEAMYSYLTQDNTIE